MKETLLFMSVEADSGVTEADTVTAEADSVSTDAASVRGKAGGDRPRVRPWGRVRVCLSGLQPGVCGYRRLPIRLPSG